MTNNNTSEMDFYEFFEEEEIKSIRKDLKRGKFKELSPIDPETFKGPSN